MELIIRGHANTLRLESSHIKAPPFIITLLIPEMHRRLSMSDDVIDDEPPEWRRHCKIAKDYQGRLMYRRPWDSQPASAGFSRLSRSWLDPEGSAQPISREPGSWLMMAELAASFGLKPTVAGAWATLLWAAGMIWWEHHRYYSGWQK